MASSLVKSPPLSYAERARKAQNIKSSIAAPPPQIPILKSVATPESSSSAASTVSTASTAASSVPESNSINALTPSSSTVLVSTQSPTSDISASSTKPPVTPVTPLQPAVQTSTIAATQPAAPAKPPPNVWSLRIEKMAAARATVSQSISASDPTPSTFRSQPSASIIPASSSPKTPNESSSQARGANPENWPQVGKPSMLSPAVNQADNPSSSSDALLPALPLPDSAGTRANGSHIQPSLSPRKNEKTKWVPIPPEELQAAADAALKARAQANATSSSPRKQHPRTGANNNAGNNSHTAAHTRNHSERTSAAHSRTQSRAASAHSSPRTGPGRNIGGRKLPGDDTGNEVPLPHSNASYSLTDAHGPTTMTLTSHRPSATNLNATSSYPHPPASTSQLHFPAPYPNPHPPQTYPSIPTSTHAFQVSAPTFYPQSQRSPATLSSHRHLASPIAISVALGETNNGNNASSSSPGPSMAPSPNQPATYPSPASYGPHGHGHGHGHGAYYGPAAYDFAGPSSVLSPPPSFGMNGGALAIHAPQPYPPVPPIWNGGGPPHGHGRGPSYSQQQGYNKPVPVSIPVPSAGRSPTSPSININLVGTTAANIDALRTEDTATTNASLSSSVSSISATSSGSSAGASMSTREKMVFGSIMLDGTGLSSPAVEVGPNSPHGRPSVNGHANGKSGSEDDGQKVAGAGAGVGVEAKEEAGKHAKTEDQLVDGKGLANPKAKGKDGKGKKGKLSPSSAPSNSAFKDKATEQAEKDATADVVSTLPAVQAVLNAQQAEVKWKFGTASNTPPVQRQIALPASEEAVPSGLVAELEVPNQQQQQQQQQVLHGQEHQLVGLLHQSNTMPIRLNIDTTEGAAQRSRPISPYSAHSMDLRGSASFAHMPQTTMGLGLESPHRVHSPGSLEVDPDLAVKDYGFGFGAARLQREWELERQREMMIWQENQGRFSGGGMPPGPDGGGGSQAADGTFERDADAAGAVRDNKHGRGGGADEDIWHVTPRGRRGGHGGAPGAGRGYGGGERGSGYGGRRGRGGGGSSFPRGYGRSGYPRGGGSGGLQRVPPTVPPFTVTPPQHLQPLGSMNEGAYYGPPRQPMGSYLPSPNGYDPYGPLSSQTMGVIPPMHTALPQPPVPVPMSTLSFPLDSTRYYLLGQLEYYLSPQNMAQDFFLRQRIDSRGWIPISLIASFRRVQQLTMDAQLVRDVLTLSSMVQVRGDMVRMGGWEQFVLPDAAPSTVEEQPQSYGYQNVGTSQDEKGAEQYPHLRQTASQHEAHGQQPHAGALNGDADATAISHGQQADAQIGAEGAHTNGPLVNGHTSKNHQYSSASEHDQDDEEDEEDDVVFVMGHEVGSWSPERHA